MKSAILILVLFFSQSSFAQDPETPIHLICTGQGKIKRVILHYDPKEYTNKSEFMIVGAAFASHKYESELILIGENFKKTLHLVAQVPPQHLVFAENVDIANSYSVPDVTSVLYMGPNGHDPIFMYVTYKGEWFPFSACTEEDVSKTLPSRDFDAFIQKNKGPVLVKFTASWCIPCKNAEPLLTAYVKKHPDTKLIEIDESAGATPLATRLGVQSLPTVFLFQGSKNLGQIRFIVNGNVLNDVSEIESQVNALIQE